jgi:hypothetical protein
MFEARAFQTASDRKCEFRIKRSVGHADLRVGRGHGAFCGCDVGAAFEELRGSMRDALDHAGIQHREEALLNNDVQKEGEAEGRGEDQERNHLMTQYYAQGAAVKVDEPVKTRSDAL